jgi:hypothetical protein
LELRAFPERELRREEAERRVQVRPFPSDDHPAFAASDAWDGELPEEAADVVQVASVPLRDAAGKWADPEQASLRRDVVQVAEILVFPWEPPAARPGEARYRRDVVRFAA